MIANHTQTSDTLRSHTHTPRPFFPRPVVDLLARLPFVEVDSHVRLLPFPTFMRLAAYDPPAARGSPGYVAADNFVVHASGPFAAERVALLASLFNQTPCAW